MNAEPRASIQSPPRTLTPLQNPARTFDETGWLGPLRLCDTDTMAELRSYFDNTIFKSGQLSMRHLDCAPLFDLCQSAALLDPVRAVLGNDLLIWRTRFIIKQPGGREIPWHQDGAYFKRFLSPVLNVSAWLAIDDVTVDNACVRLIPGSHKAEVPHIASPGGVDPLFDATADPAHVDESAAVNIELKAGEFFVFDESLLHASPANRSNRRRAALSVRFTVPSVAITDPQAAAVLVSGEDRSRINTLVTPRFVSQAADGVPRSNR
jgi:hypothetical protein